jgi:hypothetical protein
MPEAISGVASVDPSSTTMISYGCFEPDAASRIAVKVAESSCSSLYAGTINEIIGLAEASHIASDPAARNSAHLAALPYPGIEQGIEDFSLLQDIVLEACFESKAGFFDSQIHP